MILKSIPEYKKKGKYTLKLVRDPGSGEPLIRTGYQYTRFATHLEAQGYVTSYTLLNRGRDEYVVYVSVDKVPASDQKVELTTRMRGKMAGMNALSTATNANSECRKSYRADSGEGCDPSICKNCYSMKKYVESKRTGNPSDYTSVQKLMRNTRLLTRAPLQNVPRIDQKIFRFSAEGDLVNEQHLLNLYAIAEANPGTHFSIWTKRHEIVAPVLARYGKPSNLYLIQSSRYLNRQEELRPGYSKVFTVYSPEYLRNHPDVIINCNNQCSSCLRCYSRNNTIYINERLR